MKYRWVSWYAVPGTLTEMGKFELHYPWWITGERCSDGAQTVVAAIPLARAEAIKAVLDSHDKKPSRLEWRFNDEKDGSPFCEYFPRQKWMKWPAPPPQPHAATKDNGE